MNEKDNLSEENTYYGRNLTSEEPAVTMVKPFNFRNLTDDRVNLSTSVTPEQVIKNHTLEK